MALRSTQDIDFCERCEKEGLLIGFAKPSCEAERLNPAKDMDHPYRAAFARDRDKIVYTNAFKRLVHKSQIFISTDPSRFMTRLTHTLRVTQVAQTIARALKLNEDLAVSIALGHDIGHAPYGHLGENVLRVKMMDINGFEHNEESVWMLMLFEGLNLTRETLEGVLKHTKFDFNLYKKDRVDPFKEFWVPGCTKPFKNWFRYFGRKGGDGKLQFEGPSSLEGQVVDLADEIAYIAHDLVDLRDMGVVTDSDLPQSWIRAFGKRQRQRNIIDTFVTQAIEFNSEKLSSLPDRRSLEISHPLEFAEMVREIKEWESDIFKQKLHGQVVEVEGKIGTLFEHFDKYPTDLKKWGGVYYESISDYGYERKELVCHCIATLTDYEVDELYKNITN